MTANTRWDLFHIDLKTFFLQMQSFAVNRDFACQLQKQVIHHTLLQN